jgi:hypothetical protein
MLITDISEERIDFVIRINRISELGAKVANYGGYNFLRKAGSFVQDPHGVTFFIVTAENTSNLIMQGLSFEISCHPAGR